MLIWLLALPFAAVSVLTGHAIAYRALGVPGGDVHDYLDHAPQAVLILATLALLGLAVDARSRRRSTAPVAVLAVSAFIVQEHLERLLATGQLSFLLTSPVLWLGIALQVPLAVAVWCIARRLAEDIAAPLRRSIPRRAWFSPGQAGIVRQPCVADDLWAGSARGPPSSA